MKEAFYFPHDYSARNDDKILALRAEYGMEGYGIFWAIVETMAENENGEINISLIKGLALGFSVEAKKIEDILFFCVKIGLFIKNGEIVSSKRLHEHKNLRKELSAAGKKGAKKRWKNREANSPPNGKERKGKEKKGKKIKYMAEKDFEKFWKIFPNKIKKADSLDYFLTIPYEFLDKIISAISEQSENWKTRKPEFLPNPINWLEGERWNDELPKPKHYSELTDEECWQLMKDDPENTEGFAYELRKGDPLRWSEICLKYNN